MENIYFVVRPITRAWNDGRKSRVKKDREDLLGFTVNPVFAHWILGSAKDLEFINKDRSPQIDGLKFDASEFQFALDVWGVKEGQESLLLDYVWDEDGSASIAKEVFDLIKEKTSTFVTSLHIHSEFFYFDFKDDYGSLQMFDGIDLESIKSLA